MSFNFSFCDIRYFFKKNQRIIFFYLIFLIIGIIAGIFIAVSTDSYFSLLTNSDNVFFEFVSGKVDYSSETIKLILKNLVFILIIFVLCLNKFSGLATFVLFGFQGALMFLSITAVVSSFGFSGVLLTIFLSLPVNLVYFASNIIFSTICFSRSVIANKQKEFWFGYNNKEFWIYVLGLVLFDIIFSCLINFLFVLVLKSRVFIIF